MSLQFRVLGGPGQDNALFVEVNYGQGVDKLLFDCGEDCLDGFGFGTLQEIDDLFFSHLHMDHICGFDTFFRANYGRSSRPNRIWGPPDTARILQHRFQGFLWNLVDDAEISWWIHEIHDAEIKRFRCEVGEAFEILHEEEPLPYSDDRVILDAPHYAVRAVPMNHKTVSLAYVVEEKPKQNIDTSRLGSLGLRPGPWLQKVKAPDSDPDEAVAVGDEEHRLGDLREKLLVETPGDSIAYLTDFIMEKSVGKLLVPAIHGCRWVICECQYRNADLELARANYHMTDRQVGKIAAMAEIEELILFHLSVRYPPQEWRAMLKEAQSHFPNTRFPTHWEMGD